MSSTPGKPVKANIFAAGAVLWRKSPENPDEIEIAVIHRPKYEDWSFPKGKLDPGETAVVAALREVEEETGIRGRLGRHLGALTYPIPGHRRLKRVEYWAAEARAGEFVPNSEVDLMRWLPVSDVADQLSYPMDRKMLRRFTLNRPTPRPCSWSGMPRREVGNGTGATTPHGPWMRTAYSRPTPS